MDKRIFTFLFNTTNKYIREIKGEAPEVKKKTKEDPRVAQVTEYLKTHNFGCQHRNVVGFVEVYLDLPIGSLKAVAGRNPYRAEVPYKAPAGVMFKTAHARPRIVVSLGGGRYFDPHTLNHQNDLTESRLLFEFIHKSEVEAFLTKHGETLLQHLPILLI
jgi:hypothetical protein